MRVHEGAADRRFLTFFFPDLGRNCACGAKKDTSTVATSVVSFFFFFSATYFLRRYYGTVPLVVFSFMIAYSFNVSVANARAHAVVCVYCAGS